MALKPRTRRALAILIVLLAVAALAIVLFSSPAERHLYLTGELERFSLPQTIELSFPEASAIHLRSMELRFTRVAGPGRPREFAISGSSSQPSGSTLLRPSGRRGPLTVTVPRGAIVEAAPAGVRYSGGTVAIALEADTVQIVEANRATVRPPFWDGAGALAVSNPDEMVRLDAECREECSFELGTAPFSSLPEGQPLSLDTGLPVTLRDFRVKEAILRKVRDADISTAHAAEVSLIPGAGFAWTTIDVRPGAGIVLAGRGTVASLRQDGREILPSRWSDLLAADPATRGVFGGVILLVFLAWGLLFKRALDILVSAVFPE
jgi:hypothetical protein